jgi:hypothetical protein
LSLAYAVLVVVATTGDLVVDGTSRMNTIVWQEMNI